MGDSGILFVGATSFFEFADPQLDSGGDFLRSMTAGLFRSIDFRFLTTPAFDDFDLLIHDL